MTSPEFAHRPLHRSEAFDAVTIETVPRYKTSGLSGDEWRFSAVAKLWFKGEVIVERGYRDVETAVTALPWLLMTAFESMDDDTARKRYHELRETRCDNYGCAEKWVSRYRLKRLTAADGSWLAPEEQAYFHYYRQFCTRHLRRGDCSREDSDDNYDVIEGPGPSMAQG